MLRPMSESSEKAFGCFRWTSAIPTSPFHQSIRLTSSTWSPYKSCSKRGTCLVGSCQPVPEWQLTHAMSEFRAKSVFHRLLPGDKQRAQDPSVRLFFSRQEPISRLRLHGISVQGFGSAEDRRGGSARPGEPVLTTTDDLDVSIARGAMP